MSSIKPYGDRIAVRVAEEENMSSGGIVIPDTADKERPQKGVVTAVGTGRRLEDGQFAALEIAVGDTVLFGKYAGTEFKTESGDFLILKEDDIMATVE